MKKVQKIIFLLVLLCANCCFAQNTPHILWMQQPAISPDGQWIAFEYKGNIYKVSSSGGTAIALTANKTYNGYPKWSPDGSKIAFASERYRNFDVFIMPSRGGKATRLTYASTRDIPNGFSADGKQVYYQTNAHDIYTSVRFPDDNMWLKLYAVPATGGRSTLVNSAGTEFATFNKPGDKMLFQDRKGWEDPYRKHHVSPVTRDIWCFDVKLKKYTKVSDFKGEDREPVWGEGNHFYYLSERNGNQNVFASTLDDPAKVTQLTTFEKNPVRNLSRSDNGLLSFTQDGEIYTLAPGESPKKVIITLNVDFADEQVETFTVNSADEMAVSPNGKEIVFVFQGDVFVTSASGAVTKQITSTPQMERMVSFSPDGKTLLYSVENAGSWDIYQATIADPGEPYFYGAARIITQPVIATPKDEYQGVFSPDGNSIAYLEERKVLKVYNRKTKHTLTLMPGSGTFSFMDGDLTYRWSPDGKYIAIQTENGLEGRLGIDLVKADGTGKIDTINSAYISFRPLWGKSGKMIYYLSGREDAGNGLSDIYAMFFDRAAFKNYTRTETDPELQLERKKLDSALHPAAPHNNSVSPAAFLPNLLNLEDRTLRLTTMSAQISDAILSPDEQNLYTTATFTGNAGLWVTNQRTHQPKLLTKLNNGSGQLAISDDGKWLYLLSNGQISKINTEDGSTTPISINGTQMLNRADRRAYILQHTYHLLQKKFYDPNLHGVDWSYYYHNYSRFLNDIDNNYDFITLLTEFVGELNSSHSGAGSTAVYSDGDKTAALGLLYDLSVANDGLKVTDILADGPFDNSETHLKVGDIIDQVDGDTVKSDEDWSKLLNLKAGKNTSISFHDPVSKKQYREIVKPVSLADEDQSLLYKRWVRKMEHLTDSLSHGTIAYVHIREMNDVSLRATYEGAVGRGTGKKAVILDTRFNTGGNIHEKLMALVGTNNGVLDNRPQGAKLVDEGDLGSLDKPTCVIVSEGNYSDGYNFPYLYQLRKAGKLVGMPVAGTGTAAWYEIQIDPAIYVGSPGIGLSLPGVNQPLLENHQIDPDILVNNDYEQLLQGHDQQLEAAVRELLAEIKIKNHN
jgi:tricorn protease